MKKETYVRALLQLMYQNKLDVQHNNHVVMPLITFPVAYVLRDRVYLFDYVAQSVPRRNGEFIEEVYIDEAIQRYNQNPQAWNYKMMKLCSGEAYKEKNH